MGIVILYIIISIICIVALQPKTTEQWAVATFAVFAATPIVGVLIFLMIYRSKK